MASVVKGFFAPRQRLFLHFFVIAMASAVALTAVAQTPAQPQLPQQPSSVPGQSAPHTSAYTSNAPVGVAGLSPLYRISPGDELDVSVYGAPELSQRTRVNGQGEIYLPLINNQHVGGLTVENAQSAVEKALRDGGFLNAPHVNITVTSRADAVVVMGEVAKPGNYPMVGTGKLSDVLSAAGGTTQSAGRTIVIVHKDGTRQNVMLPKDPTEALDVQLSQGDTINVSKGGVIYVVGEVLAPSGFVMDQRLDYTVSKVIAMAHGTTRGAKLSKSRIVRQTPTGLQSIPVPLDKILTSKAADITLLPEDILFIPTNGAKAAASKAGDIAIGLASGATLIGLQRY